VQEIGAEQRVGGFVEQHPGVPAMRQVRRLHEAEAMLPVVNASRRSSGPRAGLAGAKSSTLTSLPTRLQRARDCWRQLVPLVQRPAFVRLEVAEADPANSRGIDQAGDRFVHEREQGAHAGVEQQRLVVEHEELVELEVRPPG
jgi:hypothetical protein